MRKKLLWSLLIVVFLLWLAAPYILGVFLLGGTSREMIAQSVSPDKTYKLVAYKVNGGATVDWAVEVYIKNEKKDKKIYDAYHEDKADIKWISNNEVSINGEKLNLDKGETFDWRYGASHGDGSCKHRGRFCVLTTLFPRTQGTVLLSPNRK